MANVWTHARWTVAPGREDEFLTAFQAMLEEGAADVEVPRATLLRDRDRPNLFLTFAPWESIEAIERFRAAFLPRIEALGDLLQGVEIQTLDELSRGD